MKKVIALQLGETIDRYQGCEGDNVPLLGAHNLHPDVALVMSLLLNIARGKETRV